MIILSLLVLFFAIVGGYRLCWLSHSDGSFRSQFHSIIAPSSANNVLNANFRKFSNLMKLTVGKNSFPLSKAIYTDDNINQLDARFNDSPVENIDMSPEDESLISDFKLTVPGNKLDSSQRQVKKILSSSNDKLSKSRKAKRNARLVPKQKFSNENENLLLSDDYSNNESMLRSDLKNSQTTKDNKNFDEEIRALTSTDLKYDPELRESELIPRAMMKRGRKLNPGDPIEEFKRLASELSSQGKDILAQPQDLTVFTADDNTTLSELPDVDTMSNRIENVTAIVAEEDKERERIDYGPLYYQLTTKPKDLSGYIAENPLGVPMVGNDPIYEGGELPQQSEEEIEEIKIFNEHLEPSYWRLVILAVITVTQNSTRTYDAVQTIFDYIRNGTNNDKRIEYGLTQIGHDDGGEPVDGIEELVQIWCEGYAVHHLVDGYSMNRVWGEFRPDIMTSPENLKAILEQVHYALDQDTWPGALLSPRERRIRLRGGSDFMDDCLNTSENEVEPECVVDG